ncbi:MAG: GIY-YIG nuclease family protein [candidate division NC10 bacterium]|nr:GIY-YIG nuclease family protein [candidate division NC10 bacterium]
MVERVRQRRINRQKPADWRAEPGRFWIYVIRSETSGGLYVGQTNDLEGRLHQHNEPDSARSLYTRRNPGPWTLAHAEEFSSRREAMARERFLKSGQGREWLRRKLVISD